jgi:Concanavalin A-like lectin/glucanases superfamily
MRIAIVFALCGCAASNCAALPLDWNATIAASNPLNWYRFDEESGTSAIDYGSQQLHGMYGTGALDAQRGIPGRVGTAAQFGDQSTVFLSAPDIGGDWSAEFILMRTGTKSSSVLIRGIPFAFPSQALKLEQYPNTEQIGYTKFGIVDATFVPAASSPLNEWIHIVYVNQSAVDRVQLYVNGALAGTRIDHFDLPREQIGSWSDTVPESPLAIIDEVVLYNRALSPTEIAAHFAALPEPATATMAMLTGIGALSGLRRRRRLESKTVFDWLIDAGQR